MQGICLLGRIEEKQQTQREAAAEDNVKMLGEREENINKYIDDNINKPFSLITTDAYDNFSIKHIEDDYRDYNEMMQWDDEERASLMYLFNEMIDNGNKALMTIYKSTTEDDVNKKFEVIRDGLIADVNTTGMLNYTRKYRDNEGESKGWKYNPFVREVDKKRKKEYQVIGYGVCVFTSTAETLDRLMLLISLKEAGHVGSEIDNEMVEILDHLRSTGYGIS